MYKRTVVATCGHQINGFGNTPEEAQRNAEENASYHEISCPDCDEDE
ncbi:hypothetical protein M0R04_02585 [Candidatus Dojkabacteria bacterium]|jgi:hypothetical protein|nr:hypothetical protein [Candidatus Dojkabacteria bacterium]